VGFARVDITPQLTGRPVWLAGFGHGRAATAIHDPLVADAVVIEGDGKRLALVTVDLIGLFHQSVERIRRPLDGFDYVLVSSTHQHEGPDTMGLWGPNFAATGVDPHYLALVEQRVTQAVQAARDHVQPVTAHFGSARDSARVHDGRLPHVKDDELRVLRFDPAGGKSATPVGILVQWNCHPETLGSKNTLITADFPAFTRRHLEQRFGCPVAYFSGDIGGMMTSLGLDVRTDDGRPLKDGTFEKAEQYGRWIGELTERALQDAEPVPLTPIVVRARTLYLPVDNAAFRAMFIAGVIRRQAYRWEESTERATPVEGRVLTGRMAVRTELGVLSLGAVTALAVPGEIYPELVVGGIQQPPDPAADFPSAAKEPILFESLGPASRKLVFGLANDELGYIIPKSQWDTAPPYAYGRNSSQYGEINSLGPETASILCAAFRKLLSN
jgi:hypothetical protein